MGELAAELCALPPAVLAPYRTATWKVGQGSGSDP